MPEGIFEFRGKEVRVGNYGGVAEGLPEIVQTPLPNLSNIDGETMSFEDSFKKKYNDAPGGDRIESVSLADISTDKRYKSVFIGSNPEEMHAQQQSWTEKAYRDTLKFGTLVGTTIAGGFGMVYGAGKWALPGGKFSDIWSNPIMQGLDKINTAVDEALPNYYTEAEKNAEWYSTDNWMTANFLFDKVIKNSGFAVGAMLSGNIANGLMSTTGASVGSLAARGAASLGETSTAFKLFTPILKNASRAFSVGENAAAANVLRTQATSIADIASQSTKLLAIEKQAAGFSKFNMAARRTAIAAYSSAGEASFEALQTSNAFREKLLSDYFYENGKNAEGEELAKIDDLSRRVGKMSFLTNMSLLTLTEFQQLPYLAGSSFKKSRQAANELLGKVDDAVLKDSKYVSAVAESAPSTRFGKVYKGVTDAGGALLRGRATYLFDPKESLQELGQYAIQVGTENYYDKAYKGKQAEGIIDSFADIAGYGFFGRDEKGEGVGALVSKEGLESAVIGGITGGPMQAMGVYSEKKQIKAYTTEFLKELNNSPTLKQAFIDKMDGVNRGVQLQKDHQTAVLNNDKLESVDAMTDLMHNYLAPRIKYGKFDMIMQDLNDLKASAMENNGEGLEILKGQGIGNTEDTVESFTARISAVQEKAKLIQETYEYMNLNYSGQTIIGTDGKQYLKYSPEVIDKMVYATTKIADYDKRLPVLAATLTANKILVDPIVSEVLKENKVDLLNQSLETIREIDNPNVRKNLEEELLDSVDLGLRRKKFINELNEMIAAPDKFKTQEAKRKTKETEESTTKETITVNIKDGKGKTKQKEIEIGTDYLVGRITEYDKKGNEVYRAIRIRVLGKTEDGKKLRIEDVATGVITEVSPEKLEDYQLGKASEATKKQIWIANNWNKVFIHKKLKDKNTKSGFVEGRIENHPQEGKMYFKYIDDKGVEQKIAVTNDMFVPKPGSKYKEGIIAPRDPLVATEQKTFEEIFGDKEEITSDMITERADYLSTLHEEGIKRIEEINNKLDKNREALDKSAEELEEKTNDLTYTKKGTLRKSGFAPIQKAINNIKTVIDNLEKQNAELNKEKAELEYTLPFYEEAIEQLSEFKDDNSALIEKMQSQIKLVEDLLKVTDDTIKRTESLLDQANDLFVKAVKAIEKFIDNLKEANPDLKTIFLDEYQESMERFLGEEGAKQIIDNKEGYTRRLIELQGQIAAFTDEMNLPKLQSNIDGLIQDIKDLEKGLEDLTKENNKRKEILAKFQTFVDDQERREKEETLINKNPKVKKAALGTKDTKTIQTRESNIDFEKSSKKPSNILPRATAGIDRGKPHQTRARNFGIRLPNLPNKDEIRGIYITAKTEKALGIPGLTKKLATDERGNIDKSIATNQTIVMVMVNTNGQFVNEMGEAITEGDVLEQAIYQVMPDPKFEWSSEFSEDGKPVSMFRKGTPKGVIDQVIEKYTAEREEILSDDYVAEPHTIAASFGLPVFERDGDGNIIYSTRTSIADADLVQSNEDIQNKQVVIVPTKGDAETRGLVSFMNAIGKPFVQTENGLVPLQNKQHSPQQAETIYNALVQLAKNMMDPKEGINGNKSVRLLQYLKSVVYWGIPEDASGKRIDPGFNSIFFEEDPKTGNLMLTISNTGKNIRFTPTELERNRGEVIDRIENLYSNVNSYMVRQINDSYEQITSIAEDGTIEFITWPNYQSYLVSNTMPDSEGNLGGAERTDIPLTTIMKPVNRETGETNRTSIYFYTTDTAEDYAFAEIEKRVKSGSKKKITAGKLNIEAEEGTTIIYKGGKYTVTEDGAGDISIVNSKGNIISEKTEIGKAVLDKYFGKEEKPAKQPKEKARNNPKEWKPDGETENTYTTPKGTEVKFIANKNTNARNFKDAIVITDIENVLAVVETVRKIGKENGQKLTDEQIEEIILNDLKTNIFNLLPKAEKKTSGGRGGFNPFSSGKGKRRAKPAAAFSEEDVEEEVKEEVKKEAKKKKTPKEETKPAPKKTITRNTVAGRGGSRRENYRLIIQQRLANMATENWDDIEKFLKASFPNKPVYRVKNILKNTDGSKQAWGMVRDGAIYLYENAEVGTVYHEVFEAIWETFTTPQERLRLIKEFKSREGSFVDRPTGETIEYKNADPEQIREQLAEECRDYFQEGKIPPKPQGKVGIVAFFADLLRTIKEVFFGPQAQSNTEKLFQDLAKGKYAKKYSPTSEEAFVNIGIQDIDEIILRDDDRLREKLPLTDIQRSEIIQEMTYATLAILVKNDKSLFEETALTSTELYQDLYDDLMGIFDASDLDLNYSKDNDNLDDDELEQVEKLLSENDYLRTAVAENWDSLVARHKEYLKGYQIEFDENDNVALNDYEKGKDEGFGDATKIDHFKKANRAIKLLLSTLYYTDENGEMLLSSIGGARLIPTSKVFVNILNTVSTASSPTQMLEKLRVMSEMDPNYRALYKRLTKKSFDDGKADLTNVTTTQGEQLVAAFWRTFKKYNSAVRNVTILDNGDVVVGEAHLSNVANQLRDQYTKAIVLKAKQDKGFFYYDRKEKAYKSDSLKARSTRLTTKTSISKFLKDLGADFSTAEIDKLEREFPKDYKKFIDAVYGIKDSLVKGAYVYKLSAKQANISTRLLQLGYIKAKLSNPDANSTYYNISGEPSQSYIGPNAPSQLYEAIGSLDSLTQEELSEYPQFNYLLTDVFSKGSRVLKRLFGTDKKRKTTEATDDEDLLMAGFVGGLDNQEKGKSKPSAKLNYRERLIQEFNLNLKGWYLNLIPGDSSLEHMTKMGNEIKPSALASGMDAVNKVFKDYFIDEINLSREERPIVEVKLTDEDIANGRRQRRTTDLRFFKDILENKEGKTADEKNKLHDDIVAYEGTPEEVYAKFEKEINSALEKFVNQDVNNMVNVLNMYNLIEVSGKKVSLKNIDMPKNMEEQQFKREMTALTVNYMIANIEMHKLLYSDPYQYAEELKRIKSFNSPRQLIVGNDDNMNQVFNNVWNQGYKKGDIGYTEFITDSFKTATLTDITGLIDLPGYKGYKETDGAGMIIQKAYRHFRIRAGEWNDAEERQYRYDVAYEKVVRGEGMTKAQKKAKGYDLTAEEEAFNIERVETIDGKVKYVGNNPKVQSAYTNLKPIVSGNKADGNNYNDVVLDKFALFPLSFRILHELNPTSNALKMYDKMQNEKIDYTVYASGRKVGAGSNTHNVYVDGKFNTAPFVKEGLDKNTANVPFEIISIQAEIPSKEEALTRRGTQITKLVTLDVMDGGVPVDFMDDTITDEDDNFSERYAAWYALSEDEKKEQSPLYEEVKNNQALLEAMTEEGVKSLLNSLGIKKVETKDRKGRVTFSYEISDFSKAGKTLIEEIFKREVNDNISDALKDFLDKGIALETTPAYQQIRNILYSIADREVVSPKISGGMKVQIPSSLLESVKAKETEINGKKGYTSDTLKFYTNADGERVCEIMIGRWFNSPLSDEELLEYLNTTDEGQRILSGLAYRIPTQQQNSIDAFKIKQFLPSEFKDSVVVPSALVEKVGSDFDIDKLSMYLKNVKINKEGYPELIEFLTDENSTVEERYVEYVKRNTDDYRDIINELNQSSEKLANKERIDSEFNKVSELRSKADDSNLEKEAAYAAGYEIFKKLPDPVQETFKQFETILKENNIEGVEKNMLYRERALDLLQKFNNQKTVEFITTSGIKLNVSSEKVIPTLEALIENYNEVNKLFGITKEMLDKYYSKLNSAKSLSDFLRKEFNIERAKIIAEFTGIETLEDFSKKSIYAQNSKKALENAYIESGERLVSHPKNFDRLIRPNSADQLKELASFVAKRTVGKEFDYTNVGNMLNRRFMSRLRHAFVTGKYAIGIAAVNQTNHSLNQRQLIFIDPNRLKKLNDTDQYWLGNGELKFEKFNTVRIGNKEYTTLSKIKNADGQDISNILGQFIDGYVDISGGPWIMEMGATPNVASTFMFLAKAGVPIDTVVYFMNQPIIKDYLRSVENEGYSYLFMDTYVKSTFEQYANKKTDRHTSPEFIAEQNNFRIPSKESLKETVGKNKKDMSPAEREAQTHILIEFMKYAKMSEQLFHVTQGSNFDTTGFNDPYLVTRKLAQLAKAQQTLFASFDEKGKSIPAVDAILKNSFLGTLVTSITEYRDALATILTSDQKRVRKVLEKVLAPYTDLSDRDFIKISQKAVADLFDYLVQTEGGSAALNKSINKLLIKDQGILPKVTKFVEEMRNVEEGHPLYGNEVIRLIEILPSQNVGEDVVNNISVKGTDNKVFDQNNIIYGFRAIKKYLKEYDDGDYKNLYKNLVKVAILQSGLSNSKISYSSVLPYEDFQDIYNNVIGRIGTISNLDSFYDLGVLQRNNWNNDDIVPAKKAIYLPEVYNKFGSKGVYNPSMYFLADNIKIAVDKGVIPPVITQTVNDREAKYDYITYTWEIDIPGVPPGLQGEAKAKMRKDGNYSFVKKGLFKKVYDDYGNPYMHRHTNNSGQVREYFVFKAINAWGDSFRANEFYTEERQSVIDNGFVKVNETEDNVIVSAFEGAGVKSLSEMVGEVPSKPVDKKTLKPSVSSKPSSVETYSDDFYNSYEPVSYDESGYDPYAMYDLAPEEFLEDYSQKTGETIGGNKNITFQEDQSFGYRERTLKNASADATIAFAFDFDSAGERLTKSSVENQNKKYIPIPIGKKEKAPKDLMPIQQMIDRIVDALNSVKAKSLNIAGNGIYTMRASGFTQEDVDKMTYNTLKAVLESPRLKTKITSIRTGGQTGYDEAGAKAGMRLGIPTTILAPKGWKFRDVTGKDISNEKQFKSRFKQPANKKSVSLPSEKNSPKGLPSINRTNKKC